MWLTWQLTFSYLTQLFCIFTSSAFFFLNINWLIICDNCLSIPVSTFSYICIFRNSAKHFLSAGMAPLAEKWCWRFVVGGATLALRCHFSESEKNVLFIKLFIVNGVCCNWSSFPSRVFFSCNFESDSIDPNFKSSLLSLLTSFGSLSATESFDVLAVPAERVLFTSAQFLLFRVSLVITCSAGGISGTFQVRLFLRCRFHLGCL